MRCVISPQKDSGVAFRIASSASPPIVSIIPLLVIPRPRIYRPQSYPPLLGLPHGPRRCLGSGGPRFESDIPALVLFQMGSSYAGDVHGEDEMGSGIGILRSELAGPFTVNGVDLLF